MFRTLSIVIALAGTFVHAGNVAEQPHLSLESLRILNHLDGWHEEKNGFVPFDHEKLFDLINGGAPEYIDGGLVRGFFQRLSGPDSSAIEIYVEDFGSPQNALNMLKLKKQSIDSVGVFADFDTNHVITIPAIGARVAYGATGRFYFEATITGIAELKKADKELRRFFMFYRKIAEAVIRTDTILQPAPIKKVR